MLSFCVQIFFLPKKFGNDPDAVEKKNDPDPQLTSRDRVHDGMHFTLVSVLGGGL